MFAYDNLIIMINDRIANNPYEFSYTLRRKLQKKVGILLVFVVSLSIITMFFIHTILFPASIKSDSMNPLLEENNQVFISPLLVPNNPIFLGKNVINRGDIVLISSRTTHDLSFIKKTINLLAGFVTFRKVYPFISSAEMTSQNILRRIVGLPGDTIYIADYTVYIKPKNSQYFLTEFELSKKMYDVLYTVDGSLPVFDQTLGTVGTMNEFTLNDDEYFVLSDNRISGIDSRIWGPVNQKEIRGKAVLRYFPLQKINVL